jgi:hypothetical protein
MTSNEQARDEPIIRLHRLQNGGDRSPQEIALRSRLASASTSGREQATGCRGRPAGAGGTARRACMVLVAAVAGDHQRAVERALAGVGTTAPGGSASHLLAEDAALWTTVEVRGGDPVGAGGSGSFGSMNTGAAVSSVMRSQPSSSVCRPVVPEAERVVLHDQRACARRRRAGAWAARAASRVL